MGQRFASSRFLSTRALSVLLAAGLGACLGAGLGGCQTTGDVTGSLPGGTAELGGARAVDVYGERYRANPKDADAALSFGQALRANGQPAQAVAVLEQGSIANPTNKALLAAYGRALADNGNYEQAFDVLSKAHSPDNPNWSLLSVQGTVLDQMGRHEEARRYYASALKIAPDEPSVLSNLGLSYLLTRELPKAEAALRKAYASPRADARVRQNLALVVGLQGRFAEAVTIVKADLKPEEAEANVAYLKEMLSRKDGGRSAMRKPASAL